MRKTMFIEVYYKHASTVARKVRGELCPWLKANTARLVRNREHQQRGRSTYHCGKRQTTTSGGPNKFIIKRDSSLENRNNPKGIWKLLKKLIPRKNKALLSTMNLCKVGTVGKIYYHQPEGPGFNPRPGQGLNFGQPSFTTSSEDRDVEPLI